VRDKDERKEEGEMKKEGIELWGVATTTYGNLPTNLRVTTTNDLHVTSQACGCDLTLANVAAAWQ